MKLKSITIQNFRCYKDETTVNFDDITTFIGKNDSGKSTILDALEIFFNNDCVKIDSDDATIGSNKICTISCEFSDLPKVIVLDSKQETNLEKEYLTFQKDTLKIEKVYDCNKTKITPTIYIVANHPTLNGADNLVYLKERDLQKIVRDRDLDVSLNGNPSMRQAIWESYGKDNLNCQITKLDVSKAKEDGKEIWAQLESYLPTFALFQSDRASQESDSEIQNPMKIAIQQAISEVKDDINKIQKKIEDKAIDIANKTRTALEDIDPDLAQQLTPNFTPPTNSKWNSLFAIGMNTDKDIPLNKRGSGIRRMLLVGFFKAEAERKAQSTNKKNIIYAIEEPETAQHPNHQLILIKSFLELSQQDNSQVILTTHSPSLASELPTDSLRFVDRDANNLPVIKTGNGILKEVAETLGILPDINNKIKVILCVEGPTDVVALQSFSRCLREEDEKIVDLSKDPRVLILPLGGSTLKHWVTAEYLKKLNCPEIHIYDNDVKKYKEYIDQINARADKSCGYITKKYEIENYLHSQAIKDIYNVDVDTNAEGVPHLFGRAYSEFKKLDGIMKDNTSKQYLSKVFKEGMTLKYLQEMDKENEVKGWFDKIMDILNDKKGEIK